VTSTIVLATPFPPELTDIGRRMVPEGFALEVVDLRDPGLPALMREAQYYVGFARPGTIGPGFFAAARGLRLVQLLSAGYDQVDLEAARRAKVPVANNGGSNAVAVAEHTMMLILAVYKKLVWQHGNVVRGLWRPGNLVDIRVHELAGKTLGIVGLGNIGKKVARRAPAFDMRVLYYDIRRLTEDEEDALGVRFALFDELLRASDVVSLHVPLNPSTRGMMNERAFALMRPEAIFINTCRGPVVDEDALYKALTAGRLAGAGLDVLVEEPPPANHPLFALDTVTLTPHMAGPTWENWPKAFRNAFDNVQRVARGQAPLWVVPELADLVG
jgi:phosphoglycerate dehydrogenase-like enzyme